ncbi:hypothetical protein [Fortiea contorta]|uniref:hypothetical protein n=1 Tax=Fortiea contorta TaxID=1892405 RepID=UPI0003486920|nr:hypothetical protein [Fortiea contorta]
MSYLFSNTGSVYRPSFQSTSYTPISTPLIPNQPIPVVNPISPALPLLPQNSFQLMV